MGRGRLPPTVGEARKTKKASGKGIVEQRGGEIGVGGREGEELLRGDAPPRAEILFCLGGRLLQLGHLFRRHIGPVVAAGVGDERDLLERSLNELPLVMRQGLTLRHLAKRDLELERLRGFRSGRAAA